MKYLLFIVLLVVVVIAAGCVTPSISTGVPSTPTAQTISDEPIIGVWEETLNDVRVSQTFTKDYQYIFTSSGPSNKPYTATGTWVKIRENEYLVTLGNDKTPYIYHPDNDSLTISGISNEPIYRAGKAP